MIRIDNRLNKMKTFKVTTRDNMSYEKILANVSKIQTVNQLLAFIKTNLSEVNYKNFNVNITAKYSDGDSSYINFDDNQDLMNKIVSLTGCYYTAETEEEAMNLTGYANWHDIDDCKIPLSALDGNT